MRTLRSYLIVSLVKGMTYGIVFVCALVMINANVVSEQPSNAGSNDCYNHFTAQITTIPDGSKCPTPVNPYR